MAKKGSVEKDLTGQDENDQSSAGAQKGAALMPVMRSQW
jgi:hypothetical protein